MVRRKPFHERLENMHRHGQAGQNRNDTAIATDSEVSDDEEDEFTARRQITDDAGEEGWRNKEGERLSDFGVDEVADFYDEDDLPLAEIIRRRKGEHN